MPGLNQRGIAQLLVIIILLGGLAAGLILIKNPTFFKPRASAGINVTFVDANSNEATSTTSPRVFVKLTSPDWSQQSSLFPKEALAQSTDSCGVPQRSPNGSICLGERCGSDGDCKTGYCCTGEQCGSIRYKCTNKDGSIPPPAAPTSSPIPTPIPTTTSVVMAEDPNFTVNNLETSFTTDPIPYTFSNPSLGSKTLYVKFISSAGSTKNANPFPATIQLVSANPTPNSSQTPTPSAVDPNLFTNLIEDVRSAQSYKYDVKDSEGHCMDTLKIIESGRPEYKYLAVYHCLSGSAFNVYLAGSDDLLNWTYITSLDSRVSQPTIERLPNGGYLVVLESSDSGNHLRFRYYQDYPSLTSGTYQKIFDAPRALSPNCSEGTPNVYSVRMSSDINTSAIDVGFHFHQYINGRCTVDREARGRLNGFSSWSAQEETGINQLLTGQGVTGNMGDRDYFDYQGNRFNLIEGQLVANNYSAWRSYIYKYADNTVRQLAITTHNGSTAFANPTLTLLTLPNGQPGFVTTFYIFSEGAASGEAGPLIYYKQL